MRLYNTLTKSVEEFVPIDKKTARVYTCGPTVYNHAHIGNLSAYIYSDILHRTLKLSGYDVKRAMNFTDVDDKTIRDSRLKYPDLEPMEALTKFTRHWEKVFRRDMQNIGNLIDEIDFERATENIIEMQKLIQHLLDQKQAYVADDGVYFDIAAYKKTRVYGQLCHIDTASQTRARIDNDEYDKEIAADFALWKKGKPGEPAWDFEIKNSVIASAEASDLIRGKQSSLDRHVASASRDDDTIDLRGRPGWHIECSAMSVKNLGQPFDIHTGGIDLVFPHHENEIAQSTAGDQPESMANFFVHNEHLLVDGKKMAKSEHNFYTLPDVKKKGFDPLDFRMLVLQSHYRSATNLSWSNLAAAQNRRRNWRNIAELRHQTNDAGDDGQAEIINNLLDQATAALVNDLDTPDALKFIDAAADVFQTSLDNISHFALQNFIKFIDDYLGLGLAVATPDITNEQKQLIKKRLAARAKKDFAKSDKVRDQLLEQGIELSDTANQTIWSRK
ncbi:hypothetical protein FWH58_03540 [Candidatus Saccharibacteria bacterium]|nr:hypothetical protein [Candidatus Saccharibacteria bacterium]